MKIPFARIYYSYYHSNINFKKKWGRCRSGKDLLMEPQFQSFMVNLEMDLGSKLKEDIANICLLFSRLGHSKQEEGYNFGTHLGKTLLFSYNTSPTAELQYQKLIRTTTLERLVKVIQQYCSRISGNVDWNILGNDLLNFHDRKFNVVSKWSEGLARTF